MRLSIKSCKVLLKDRKYKNLLNNMLGFFIGALLTIGPFAVYFWSENAFHEFLYGMIGYNIEYQKGMASWLADATVNDWIHFTVSYIPYYSMFLTAYLLYRRRQYKMVIYCLICLVLESYLFFSGARFTQYVMITIPQFMLLINEITFMNSQSKKRFLLRSLLLCMAVISGGIFVKKTIDMYHLYSLEHKIEYQELLDLVPENDKDSFVAYGDNRFKELYLLNNLLPCKKYFVIQEWHAMYSQYVKQDIYDEFASNQAKWIITAGSIENIQSILNNDYKIVGEINDYRMYYRKNKAGF